MPIAVVATRLFTQTPTVTNSPPFVDPLFSDNMVLQRDRRDPIWGWTKPGTVVTVSIDGKRSTGVADSTGKWMTTLPRFAAGGSFTLTVDGPSNQTFSNVTFGDVWICSGQSNMEFGVGNLSNPSQEIAAANYPQIRLYRVPKLISPLPTPFVHSEWQVCTPDTLAHDGDWNGFSAVGYFFGRKLNQDLKVPIGLVHTSWGGTIAEAWASAGSLEKKQPEFNSAIASVQASASAGNNFSETLAAWYAKNDPGSVATGGWFDPSVSDSDWKSMQVPNYFQKVGLPELMNEQSVVWLRKEIDLPASPKGAILHFLADDNDATWVNGTPVGMTDGYNVPRTYKIPDGVLHAGKNLIAIRVTDVSQPGGVYGDPAGISLEVPGQTAMPLAGQWKVKLSLKMGGQTVLPAKVGDNPNLPTVLFNGMIYPLAPFAVKGAIWYQGESNVGRGKQYQTLLPTMIQSWRDQFNEGNFPFLIVQLAGYGRPPAQPGDDGWADLRDAQMIASVTCPDTGIATAVDIGESNDIHPKNKQEVGRRLALVAESRTYGKNIEYSGPRFKSVRANGSEIVVSFDHGSGLKTADGQAPKGFAIAGNDRKWHWAEAKIEAGTVKLSSAEVPIPVAVRYGWANYLDLNLQNEDGLPAFPFRSDNWKPK